jgi:hypothetical protein
MPLRSSSKHVRSGGGIYPDSVGTLPSLVGAPAAAGSALSHRTGGACPSRLAPALSVSGAQNLFSRPSFLLLFSVLSVLSSSVPSVSNLFPFFGEAQL